MSNIVLSNNCSGFTIKTSTVVQIDSAIQIYGIKLPVKVTADFKDIPPRYHEEFLQFMIYKYHNCFIGSGIFKSTKTITTKKNWLQKLWKKI